MSDQENITDDSKVENNRKPGRQPGCEKTGGRKKGTPNKNSSILREALDSANFNLIEEYVEAFDALQHSRKIDELKWLMSFLYPRLSEVTPETTGVDSPEGKETLSKLQLIQMARAK